MADNQLTEQEIGVFVDFLVRAQRLWLEQQKQVCPVGDTNAKN